MTDQRRDEKIEFEAKDHNSIKWNYNYYNNKFNSNDE